MKIQLLGLVVLSLVICADSLPTGAKLEFKIKKLYSIINQLEFSSPTCSVCKGIVEFLHGIASVGIGEGELIKIATYVCKKAHVETNRVCISAVKEFADEVWNVFFRAFLEPNEICGWILGDSCIHFEQYFPSWNVTIPEITSNIAEEVDNNKEEQSESVKVIHISDTHLDNDYMEGSRVDCKEPLCCRKEDGMAGKNETAAPKWGYPGYCDSNILMVNNLLQHVAGVHKDADYIIWTGDIPPHNVWNQTRQGQINAIKQGSSFFVKYFPHLKIYPALGNHEGVPVNSFPPPYITGEESDNWLLETIADVWSIWLPEDTKTTIKIGGYYTVLVKKGFRIISLNMNYGSGSNWWLWIDSVDPAGQLQWLVNVLAKSEADREKVHILGHFPPDSMLKWWSYNYYKIVDRFQHTIAAQFFGHTHHDEFRLFYDMKTFKTPTNIAYLGPSVTTYHDLNPGYRVYEVDGVGVNSTWNVVDHHTYYMDLLKTQKTGKALWELEYSAKEAYGLKSLAPAEWNDLINRMVKDDKLFQILYRAFYKQHIKGICTGSCKNNYLCSMKTALGGGFHYFCNFEHEEEHSLFMNFRKETYNKC